MWILYIKLNVCLFVCTLYKFTFLNRSQPNFAHISPWPGRDRRVCMVQKCLTFSTWPSSGTSAESSAWNGCRRKSSATALYPWFLLVLVWRHGNDVDEFRVLQESSATELYPWFLLMLVWRHENDVVADDSFAFLLEVSCTMGNA